MNLRKFMNNINQVQKVYGFWNNDKEIQLTAESMVVGKDYGL